MKNNKLGKAIVKVAEFSAKVAADNRCMYCFHQPKMPDKVLTLKQKQN